MATPKKLDWKTLGKVPLEFFLSGVQKEYRNRAIAAVHAIEEAKLPLALAELQAACAGVKECIAINKKLRSLYAASAARQAKEEAAAAKAGQ
jgi:hypothetical protein